MSQPTSTKRSGSPLQFLTDDRFLQIAGQVVFALVLIAALYGLVTAVFSALESRNLTPNTFFLSDRAGFDIGEKPGWYSSNSSYWEAYIVGLINTLRVVVAGLVLSTVIGVFGGIFLLSTNWLIRTITTALVEVLRNTPLLLQLFVWYFAVMLSLPAFQQALSLPQEGITVVPLRFALYLVIGLVVWQRTRRMPLHDVAARRRWRIGAVALVVLAELAVQLGLIGGGAVLRLELRPWVFITIRGFAFPEIAPTARFAEWMAFIGVGIALALAAWVYYGRLRESTGVRYPRLLYGIVAIGAAAVIGWVVIAAQPTPTIIAVAGTDGTVSQLPIEQARAEGLLTAQDEALAAAGPVLFRLPEKNNFRFIVGTQISPEYMALLLGLAIYTAAFIAEIVRAGILAVPKGQVEAARALGLSASDVLGKVIMPQALRVIIPPLGNQYLNLAKNSSLAIAIAYADLFLVTTTIMNQSGQSITGMAMVMVTYLVISLTIAYVMNQANRRFQLVTR